MSKLIIIDDDPVHHYLMRYSLHDSDCVDVTTYTMDENLVLEYIEENKSMPDKLPDVILLGLNKPKFTGWNFLDKFNELYHRVEKDIKVYILASGFRPIDKERSEQYPFIKSYLSKPLNTSEINEIKGAELC